MSTVLDTIEVEIEHEHDGEVLTLDVEITAWSTRKTHSHPGDLAEWQLVCPANGHPLKTMELLVEMGFWAANNTINDQVQAHCAEHARPREEG
jgi:hypothetical protein